MSYTDKLDRPKSTAAHKRYLMNLNTIGNVMLVAYKLKRFDAMDVAFLNLPYAFLQRMVREGWIGRGKTQGTYIL